MHMLTRLLLTVSICGLGACAGMEVRPDAQISFEQGLALFNQGRHEEAIPNFMQATQLDPNFGRGYLYLGRSYLNLGRWQEAVPPLRAALRLAPDETKQDVVRVLIDALIGAATHQLQLDNTQASIGLLKEVLKLQPQSVQAMQQLVGALLALGGQLLSQGKANAAIDTYLEATQLAPSNLDAYLGLARAFFQHGDLSKTLAAVQSALRLSPTSLDALSLLQQLQRR